jgi:phytoene synthase
MSNHGLSYSGDLVRRHDPDRFLAGLLAPAGCRDALWALYAFNYEIARTRETVSNTTLGLIRLQWWRDAFAAIYQGLPPPRHQVVDDLAPAVRAYDLPRDLFERLLYAREFDLEDEQPGNMQGLENYADFTGTPLLQLSLKIAGQEEGEHTAAIAKAYAMTGLLRAVPFHAGQRRCYLPSDLLRREGVEVENLYAGRTDGLTPVVRAVAVHAEGLLKDRRPKAKLARVMALQARLWLRHMARLDYDLLDARMNGPPPFYAARLVLA